MKCKICGAESGKYPLCRTCNIKKQKGEVIKCSKCRSWHYRDAPCSIITTIPNGDKYLYNVKKRLISKNEQEYFNIIKSSVPDGFCVFPQINLASFIERTDDARFRNELFRNVDFLITDSEYCPKVVIEINDQSHITNERKERDEKVQKICEEAGIPIIRLWTSYGANAEYIKRRIEETLNSIPIARKHHFSQSIVIQSPGVPNNPQQDAQQKGGCYIATCVYGTYDCPEVWVLRRYRDNILSNKLLGRIFIKLYYAFSPTVVKYFGDLKWFKSIFKGILDKKVYKLLRMGFKDTPYNDK